MNEYVYKMNGLERGMRTTAAFHEKKNITNKTKSLRHTCRCTSS